MDLNLLLPIRLHVVMLNSPQGQLTSTLGSIQLMSIKFGTNVFQKEEYFYKYSVKSETMQCKTHVSLIKLLIRDNVYFEASNKIQRRNLAHHQQ